MYNSSVPIMHCHIGKSSIDILSGRYTPGKRGTSFTIYLPDGWVINQDNKLLLLK